MPEVAPQRVASEDIASGGVASEGVASEGVASEGIDVLRIDVLGALRVTLRGAPVQVDTRKALAILVLLATAMSVAGTDGSQLVSRDRLAGLLWPDAGEARAKATLRRTLSVLIAATEGAVVADRRSVHVHPELVQSDIVSLRTLAASDDPDQLSRAVALVRGEFLDGFRLRECEPFDAWLAQESDALRREVGAILERLVLARMRRGEFHAALADAARWLELDPLHEPAHRSVMRLLSWTGRRQDALDHYRRCVRLLADELGVAPVRATTAVFDAIRAGTLEAPKRGRPVASAPTEAVARTAIPMIGRDGALATLTSAVGQSGRLVLVTGEAGVGRSRLIEEFAASASPVIVARAHEGEAALSFAPIGDLLREALPRVARLDDDLAVEIARVVPECLPPGREVPPPFESPGGRDRFFDAVLRTLALVEAKAVVVDDVHAASPDGAELLSYLVHRLHRLRSPLVLTWREPGLPARHPVRRALATGRFAQQITSVPLLRLTVADVEALVSAAGAELDAASLHAQTAGLPLLLAEAIRAGRSDVLSVPVRDLLAARLAEVTEETGQVLGALAVCAGLADVSMLRSTSGRSDPETVDAVDEAVAAGLVREETGGVAFTHDALRQVAHDQLSLARRRLLHARAAEAISATPGAEARAGQLARHWHEAGRDDLAVAAAREAATRAAELFAHEETVRQVQFVVGLGGDGVDVALLEGDALVALGRYEQALICFERAAAMADRGPAELRARIERRSADVHARAGEWALADEGLAAAVELVVLAVALAGAAGQSEAVDPSASGQAGRATLAERAGLADRGLPAGQAELLSQLLADRALVALHLDPARAAALVTSAVAVDRADLGYVRNVAGLVALRAGDPDLARASFTAALDSASQLVLRAGVLNNLAHALAESGDGRAAVATAREALALGAVHGDRHRLAALHANLADRLHETGAGEEALEHLKISAGLFAEVGADPLDRPDIWTLTSW